MSQKSPILEMITKLRTSLEKMNVRERLLVVGTGLIVIGTFWYVGLMEPALKSIKRDKNEIQAVQKRIESVNQNIEVQALQASSGAIGYREQYTLVKRRLEELKEQLGDYTAELIGPGEMARVLQGVLREQDNLRLIQIRNLPAQQMAAQDGANTIFYKHGLELEFEGGFFAALEYLEQIESLPWRIYWQVLELEVIEYPRNRIRLEVSTLSPYEEWIGA
ncbi:MAG: type II secretion system protein GspM [Woeseiaceae bacterium]|nr:type II secretion system protein GspM [Woeseiaceae bacterium]